MTAVPLTTAAILEKRMILAAREKDLPIPMNLTNALVVRTPVFWLNIFELRGTQPHHLETEDGVTGKLGLAFLEAVNRVFSGREEPPYVLEGEQRMDASELVDVFKSIGALYCYVPLDATNIEGSITTLLLVLRPLISVAKKLIRRMNARTITSLGGSGERYVAARLLDPANYSLEDREALKRAITKPEAPLDTSAGRVRVREPMTPRDPTAPAGKDTCAICGKHFALGTWAQHRRKDCK